jgi:hypothetical protein
MAKKLISRKGGKAFKVFTKKPVFKNVLTTKRQKIN